MKPGNRITKSILKTRSCKNLFSLLAGVIFFVIGLASNTLASPGGKDYKPVFLVDNYLSGPADVNNPLTNISVIANNAVADGVAKNSINVHLADSAGNPVPSTDVTFTINNGSSGINPVVETDSNGNAVLDLSSTVIGTVTITAKVNGVSIIFGSPALVFFVAGPPVVTVPTTDLTVVTNDAIANGTATNSVEAHITDVNGNPVSGVLVIFSIASGTGSFTGSPIVTTDSNGNAVVTLTSTVAGNVGITATVVGLTITNGSPATVTFVAGPPSVSNPATALTVVTNNAIANGTATNSVQAHIVDANGNIVSNQAVTFSIASGSGSFVGSSTVTTDVNGNAVIPITSTVAGNVGITATVGGNALTNGSPAVVTFVAGPPSVNNAATALSVVTNNAIANGTATNSVQAHIADANGNLVANQAVVFSIVSGTGSFVGSTTVITDANGNAVRVYSKI